MHSRTNVTSILIVLLSLLLAPMSAFGQPKGKDYLKLANDLAGPAPGTKDACEVLFPKIVAMAEPPASTMTLRQLSLMTQSSPGWKAWEEWAKAPAQQEVLAALKTIGDPKSKYTLALKFGKDSVDPSWVKAGLYIDVGNPAIIARASHEPAYLKRLDDVVRLCTVEATRLAGEAKSDDVAAVLLAWTRFARMVADRPFAVEKTWAFRQFNDSLERLRDIACSFPGAIGEKQVQELNRDLDLRAINSQRIRFPEGERLALEQIIELTMEERGGPRIDEFGLVVGQVTAGENPMDLFPQAAFWSLVAAQHGGWFDTREQVQKVLGDWQKRWDINNIFDLIMLDPTDYSKMDRAKFAVVDLLVKDISTLFDLRILALTELTGTRSALAVHGYKLGQGQWPKTLPPVQPKYVQRLDDDPWYFEREREVRQHFRFFVPVRDSQVGPRELPRPHTIIVNMPEGQGATSVAQGSAADSLFDMESLGISLLQPIASQVYDSASGSVDVPKLKELWTLAARSQEVTDDDLAMAQIAFEAIAKMNVSPEQTAAGVQAMLASPAASDAIARIAPSIGLTTDEFKQYIAKVTPAQLRSASYQELLSTARSGGKLTKAQLTRSAEESVSIMTQPDIVEPYIRKILAKSLEGVSAGGSSEMPGSTITAEEWDELLTSVTAPLENNANMLQALQTQLANRTGEGRAKYLEDMRKLNTALPRAYRKLLKVEESASIPVSQLWGRVAEEIESSPEYLAALRKVATNPAVTIDIVKSEYRIGFERLAARLLGGPPPAGSFSINLTDKDFVLYSVGTNGTADWARSVGEAGADILIWPPLLTLERRRASGN